MYDSFHQFSFFVDIIDRLVNYDKEHVRIRIIIVEQNRKKMYGQLGVYDKD